MGIKNFSVNEYVNSRLANVDINNLNQDEYDNIINAQDTFYRNVRNVLKHFPKNYELGCFEFDTDVFKYFPLNYLDNTSIGSFLDHIFKFKQEKNMVGNKLLSNLNKITVDNKNPCVDSKWRNFDFFYIEEPNKSDFATKININKQTYRNIIRNNPLEVKTINRNFKQHILELKKSENVSDLGVLVDLSSDIILQMINYWVITIENVTFQNKVILSNEIEAYLANYQDKIIKNGIQCNSILNLNDAITMFATFLERRNDFGEYINVINELMEEEKLDSEYFGTVPDSYKLNKRSSYVNVKFENIILEGRHIDQFNEKLQNTKEAIKIFQKYGGRIADENNLLDLKVYFREIYLSNCKYKVKASTIVRKMLQKYKVDARPDSCDKASEYLFLREKISRGYFRETSTIELYHLKNKLQKIVYKTLITSMLCYNYQCSLDYIDELIDGLTPLCFRGIDDSLDEYGGARIF